MAHKRLGRALLVLVPLGIACSGCQGPPGASSPADAGPGSDAATSCGDRIGRLSQAVEISEGHDVMDLAVADFDGDGNLDAAALRSRGAQGLAIAWGTSSGGFRAPSYFHAYDGDGGAGGILAADVDRDGRDDLVTLGGNTLKIWINGGSASFPRTLTYYASCTGRLFAGLVDDDPHLDLIASCRGVPVFYGLGDGRFSPERPALTDTVATVAAVGFVDGDGRLDLLTAGQTLTVHAGGATGFSEQGVALLNESTTAVSLVDITAGLLDVVAANWQRTTASYLLNRGGGDFSPPDILDLGIQPASIGGGDVDGNGSTEIVAIEASGYPFTGSLVSITEWFDEGYFGFSRFFPALDEPRALVIAREGRADRMFVANGRYVASLSGVTAIRLGSRADAMIATDIDSDGVQDVVALSREAGRLSLVLGGPTLRASTALIDVPDGWQPVGVAAGDFTGDGRVDLVVTASDRSTLLFENREDVYVGPAHPWTSEPSEGLVRSGDFDGDGNLDVLFVPAYEGPLTVSFGDGAGAEAQRVQLDADAAGHRGVVVEDLDRDGLTDVVFSTGFPDDRTWMVFVSPDRTFARVELTGGTPRHVTAGDLSQRDGRQEVLLMGRDRGGELLEVIDVRDDRTTDHSYYELPRPYGWITAADMDGDGFTDLLGQNGPILEWLEGWGGLRGLHAFPVQEPLILDLDGDGTLDLAGLAWPGGERSPNAEAIFFAPGACR